MRKEIRDLVEEESQGEQSVDVTRLGILSILPGTYKHEVEVNFNRDNLLRVDIPANRFNHSEMYMLGRYGVIFFNN